MQRNTLFSAYMVGLSLVVAPIAMSMPQTAQIPSDALIGYLPVDNSRTFYKETGETRWKTEDGQWADEKLDPVIGPKGRFVDPSPADSAKHKRALTINFKNAQGPLTYTVALNLDDGILKGRIFQPEPFEEIAGSVFLWKLEPERFETVDTKDFIALTIFCKDRSRCGYAQVNSSSKQMEGTAQDFTIAVPTDSDVGALKDAITYFIRHTVERR